MLVDPSLDELLTKVNNKFELVTLALKRARQINDGCSSVENYNAAKPVSMALQEISRGEVFVDHTAGKRVSEVIPTLDEDVESVDGEALTAALAGPEAKPSPEDSDIVNLYSSVSTQSDININDFSGETPSLADFVANLNDEAEAESENMAPVEDLLEAVNSEARKQEDKQLEFIAPSQAES